MQVVVIEACRARRFSESRTPSRDRRPESRHAWIDAVAKPREGLVEPLERDRGTHVGHTGGEEAVDVGCESPLHSGVLPQRIDNPVHELGTLGAMCQRDAAVW